MNALISIPTIFICTAITMLMVAVALTLYWVFDRREAATAWWAAGMWVGFLGVSFGATRLVMPAWFGIGISNALILFCMSLVSAGFAAFSGTRPSRIAVLAGPAIWVALYVGSEAFREEITYRIVLLSVVMAVYSAVMVQRAWNGWKSEHLPTFLATVIIYGAHGLMYVARIPVSIIHPAKDVNGQVVASWGGIFFLEGFALTVMSAFVFLSLIKERAERRYRLAAEIDGLTLAATRRFFVSQTTELLARKNAKGVLAVIDLDHFKSVNDSFGHMGGDRVLKAFGNYVTDQLEPDMVFGRLGGEEFGIYIPGQSEREAGEFLERLRTGIEAMEIPFMGSPIRVTISVGVASVRDAGVNFDHLMAAADSALYIAKEEGRNRLRFFSISMRMHKIIEAGMESRVGLADSRLSRAGVRVRAGRS